MKNFRKLFIIPAIVLVGIIAYFVIKYLGYTLIANIIIIATIIIGSLKLVQETIISLLNKEFALDYIAILAITVGIVSGNYIVAAVIVLMMAGGNALEQYGIARAKQSLTGLVDRIPNEVTIIDATGITTTLARGDVQIGQEILLRKGEVIPLDGELLSDEAAVDESSLTGEPYPRDKVKGNMISSGTVNVGEPFTMRVTKEDKDSTYAKIIEMVQKAQEDKSPIIRLADKYSVIFTIVTLAIAGLAWFLHRDLQSVLAVLVIATPCPLILATPIALMGGMGSAAKKLIIVKHLAAIEALARVNALVFDKTGTITLGKPEVTELVSDGVTLSAHQPPENLHTFIQIAAAIENNSLHPLAKSIVLYAEKLGLQKVGITQVKEIIGHGIQGSYAGKTYRLGKLETGQGMNIGMREVNDHQENLVLQFTFADQIKADSADIIRKLLAEGLETSIYTGDHADAANKVAHAIDPSIKVVANCKPEDKQIGIQELHAKGKVVGMVGDGINDAPALAMADVGMVFSNSEHTATTETADIVFLAGTFRSVLDALTIAQKSVRIAKESIWFGMGLSTLGMLLAAFGYIPPIVGAGIQELLDVIAILNALRASRL